MLRTLTNGYLRIIYYPRTNSYMASYTYVCITSQIFLDKNSEIFEITLRSIGFSICFFSLVVMSASPQIQDAIDAAGVQIHRSIADLRTIILAKIAKKLSCWKLLYPLSNPFLEVILCTPRPIAYSGRLSSQRLPKLLLLLISSTN
ncbi:hypothetical protein BDP27DRAFT_714605 [Rhodocollybia butyracea]|uniref:Uncharacterized protein n=1 Tax=Rhodocollybia butyracea TaxID=206335 RepID=A0A9P5UF98_9AGAR|nr:hypothetical protein BDP27DRAFT_714605 [Rhodocollybia butyracea]